METGSDFVGSRLGVAAAVEESAGAGSAEPREIVTGIPVDELMAVGREEAGLRTR